MAEDERKKVFEIARKYATEDIGKNKEMLKRYVRVQKALLSQKEAARKDKDTRRMAVKSKAVAEVTKFGGEWKNGDKMKQALSECASETAKLNALRAQLRFHRHVLETDKYLADKKDLFRMTNLPIDTMMNNLLQIMNASRHYEHLADIEDETVKVTGLTLLSSEERETLYRQRVTALSNKRDQEKKKREMPANDKS